MKDAVRLLSDIRGVSPTGSIVRLIRAQHSGEFRDKRRLRNYCKIDESNDGKFTCTHGGGIIRVSHWSCCGALERNAPCRSTSSSSQDDPESYSDALCALVGMLQSTLSSALIGSAHQPISSRHLKVVRAGDKSVQGLVHSIKLELRSSDNAITQPAKAKADSFPLSNTLPVTVMPLTPAAELKKHVLRAAGPIDDAVYVAHCRNLVGCIILHRGASSKEESLLARVLAYDEALGAHLLENRSLTDLAASAHYSFGLAEPLFAGPLVPSCVEWWVLAVRTYQVL